VQLAHAKGTPDLTGRLVAGRYRLSGFLGRGGFGSVWSGHDERTGEQVAVKVFSRADGLAPRALREARTATKLQHPNVHRVLGVERDEEHAYLVSELVVGDRLSRRDLSDEEAVRALAAVADALAHAHAHGVVHRDVKPSNILVSDDGHVTLTDFGIARDEDAGEQTVDERVLGTLSYMAPEQASGEQASGATDVWAAALTLYEALTGENPFRAKSLRELLDRLDEGAPRLGELRPDLPRALERLLARALHPDPARRPSAARLRYGLLAALAGDEQPSAHEAAPRQLQAPSAAPALHLAGGALALLGVLWTLDAFPVYPAAWSVPIAACVGLVALRSPLAAACLGAAACLPGFWNFAEGAGIAFAVVAAAWLVAGRRSGVRVLFPLAAGVLGALAPLAGVPAFVLVAATAPTPRRRAAEAAAGGIVAALVAGVVPAHGVAALAGTESPLAVAELALRTGPLLSLVTAMVAFSLLLRFVWHRYATARTRALCAWGAGFLAVLLGVTQGFGLAPEQVVALAGAAVFTAILPAAWALAGPWFVSGRS
jgi:eukaryotic-like serine/threonine-protein kinase